MDIMRVVYAAVVVCAALLTGSHAFEVAADRSALLQAIPPGSHFAYSTLTAVAAHTGVTSQTGCGSESFLRLPAGWDLADDSTVSHTQLLTYARFQTSWLVGANGVAWAHGGSLSIPAQLETDVDDGETGYRCSSCPCRVLLQKAISRTEPTIAPAPLDIHIFTHSSGQWAALDASGGVGLPVEHTWTVGEPRAIPDGWELPTTTNPGIWSFLQSRSEELNQFSPPSDSTWVVAGGAAISKAGTVNHNQLVEMKAVNAAGDGVEEDGLVFVGPVRSEQRVLIFKTGSKPENWSPDSVELSSGFLSSDGFQYNTLGGLITSLGIVHPGSKACAHGLAVPVDDGWSVADYRPSDLLAANLETTCLLGEAGACFSGSEGLGAAPEDPGIVYTPITSSKDDHFLDTSIISAHSCPSRVLIRRRCVMDCMGVCGGSHVTNVCGLCAISGEKLSCLSCSGNGARASLSADCVCDEGYCGDLCESPCDSTDGVPGSGSVGGSASAQDGASLSSGETSLVTNSTVASTTVGSTAGMVLLFLAWRKFKSKNTKIIHRTTVIAAPPGFQPARDEDGKLLRDKEGALVMVPLPGHGPDGLPLTHPAAGPASSVEMDEMVMSRKAADVPPPKYPGGSSQRGIYTPGAPPGSAGSSLLGSAKNLETSPRFDLSAVPSHAASDSSGDIANILDALSDDDFNLDDIVDDDFFSQMPNSASRPEGQRSGLQRRDSAALFKFSSSIADLSDFKQDPVLESSSQDLSDSFTSHASPRSITASRSALNLAKEAKKRVSGSPTMTAASGTAAGASAWGSSKKKRKRRGVAETHTTASSAFSSTKSKKKAETASKYSGWMGGEGDVSNGSDSDGDAIAAFTTTGVAPAKKTGKASSSSGWSSSKWGAPKVDHSALESNTEDGGRGGFRGWGARKAGGAGRAPPRTGSAGSGFSSSSTTKNPAGSMSPGRRTSSSAGSAFSGTSNPVVPTGLANGSRGVASGFGGRSRGGARGVGISAVWARTGSASSGTRPTSQENAISDPVADEAPRTGNTWKMGRDF